ncbi:BadF/BadG/BcrA/BcrD ATPase family protein [Heyndrickxia acidicola]|uniref:BadF/BadG/BcrA/BcrD ATPase family protein n=1 Tax=Heyndrickxia acidicola TaxID=209389 RepID=A0ABU6MDN5_9BACI|nr:BadF/BadG/BcrA/BcrD ATPase family protein [Heyndrickxia acidicola]MED1202781.1 BadF/BadG/BcrA/BcrD ATPase family protein [Heyndrickxia acidicola]
MGLLIGIDAGGTKTKAMILKNATDAVFETACGYGNPAINYKTALANISFAITSCLESEFGGECKEIVIGVAGIEAGENRQKLQQDLKVVTQLSTILVTDAELAYYAYMGDKDGILTIAGTGSISYGRNGEQGSYIGGWGHLLGDAGSSYYVAIQACKQMINEEESNKEYSPLTRAILDRLGMTKVKEIKGFIYQSKKDDIASLSYTVYLQAVKGDHIAQMLFEIAGVQLADQTLRLIHILQLECPIKVACAGSLLESNQIVKNAFRNRLKDSHLEIHFIDKIIPAVYGAYYISKSQYFSKEL